MAKHGKTMQNARLKHDKTMQNPGFGDGLYMFILVCSNSYTRIFFCWGYGIAIKELLPHTIVDRTHHLLAMRIRHCPIAFHCLRSQPKFTYPDSPGIPSNFYKHDLPSSKEFTHWQKCSHFLSLGFRDCYIMARYHQMPFKISHSNVLCYSWFAKLCGKSICSFFPIDLSRWRWD